MAKANHAADDMIRDMWALFLNVPVSKDGQVKGFGEWWNKAHPKKREHAERIEQRLRDGLMRGGVPDALVSSGAADLRSFDRDFVPPRESRSSDDYARFRQSVIRSVLDHKWKPLEVAKVLEASRADFPEIEQKEIDAYAAMGETWDMATLERFGL